MEKFYPQQNNDFSCFLKSRAKKYMNEMQYIMFSEGSYLYKVIKYIVSIKILDTYAGRLSQQKSMKYQKKIPVVQYRYIVHWTSIIIDQSQDGLS
jgi:hypothetical protein